MLKSPNCDCPGSADLSDGATGGDVGLTPYDFDLRPGGVDVTHASEIVISASSLGTDTIEFALEIDGVNVWSSSCMAGSTEGTTVAIPDLANVATVIVNVSCGGYIPGGSYSWSFTVAAYGIRC